MRRGDVRLWKARPDERARDAKDSLAKAWREKVSPELIEAALQNGGAGQLLKQIASLLQPYEPGTPEAINLLGYRCTDALTDVVAKGQAGAFLTALRTLLLSAQNGQADINGFIQTITPLLDEAALDTSKLAARPALATREHPRLADCYQ